MRLSLWSVILAVFTATGALFFFGSVRKLPGPSVALPVRPGSVSISGVSSCSGSNCHGGQLTPDLDRISPFAATIWLEHDPHSKAFHVLLGETSKQIMEKLGSRNPAFEDERCLACHTNPEKVYEPETHNVDLSSFARTERKSGISCAVCHGDSQKWLTSHSTWQKTDVDRNDVERKSLRIDSGMTWLNDTDERAMLCVSCHVGSPARGAIPRRDVTHDLIAAGHPRLMFELTTYLNAMPIHWMERDRRATNAPKREPSFTAALWLAGQLASAEATLDLLKDSLSTTDWPEFSRYDCLACHHDLRGNSNDRFSTGKLNVSSASFSLPLRRLSIDLQHFELQKHYEIISSPRLELKDILAATNDVEAFKLHGNRIELQCSTLQRTLLTVLSDENLSTQLSWDDIAQIYFALDALRNATLKHNQARGFSEELREFADSVNWTSPNIPKGNDLTNVVLRLKSLSRHLQGDVADKKPD